MEFITLLALLLLIWMIWQLVKAKKFTQFKTYIEKELKPKVIENIKNELEENRNEQSPNNDCHIQATLFYWGQYKSRILQAALQQGVIDEKWLKDTGNYRNCQHLFHIEADKMHRSANQHA